MREKGEMKLVNGVKYATRRDLEISEDEFRYVEARPDIYIKQKRGVWVGGGTYRCLEGGTSR